MNQDFVFLGGNKSNSMSKVDILAFGAHPDDVELGCGGTILKHIQQGNSAGIVDLTKGELGTRGSTELREKEADEAARILGVRFRENLNMPDGFFENNKANQLEVVKKIRQFQPEIVLTNAVEDRHPDHGRASSLVSVACFLSGLRKVKTEWNGEDQQEWRPRAVYYYIQDQLLTPDIIVDISDNIETKFEAIKAFSSQFHDPKSKEPESPISKPEFLDFVRGRCLHYGRTIGVLYGEAFTVERSIGVENILGLL